MVFKTINNVTAVTVTAALCVCTPIDFRWLYIWHFPVQIQSYFVYFVYLFSFYSYSHFIVSTFICFWWLNICYASKIHFAFSTATTMQWQGHNHYPKKIKRLCTLCLSCSFIKIGIVPVKCLKSTHMHCFCFWKQRLRIFAQNISYFWSTASIPLRFYISSISIF